MDIGATLNYLLTYPVEDPTAFMKAKSDFDGFLSRASKDQKTQVYKFLRFLTHENFMAKSLIIKYRLFVLKLLNSSYIEKPPALPPFYFPIQTGNLIEKISVPDKVKKAKIVVLTLAEQYFKKIFTHIILELKIAVHRSKHVKKAMKLAKTRIRVREFFKFSIGLFKNNTKMLKKTEELNNVLAFKALIKHGKAFRRNQKAKVLIEVFLDQIRRVFWELSIKKESTPVSTPRKTYSSLSEIFKTPTTPQSLRKSLQSFPFTPKKSPFKESPNKDFLILVNKLFLSYLKSQVNILREIIPMFKRSISLSRIYERMAAYFKKFMFIQFINNIDKKARSQRIFDILQIAQIVKHSFLYNKSSKLGLILRKLRNGRLKLVLARVSLTKKFLTNVENRLNRVSKTIFKFKYRKNCKLFLNIGKIFFGLRKVEKLSAKKVENCLSIVMRVNKYYEELFEILDRYYACMKTVKIRSLKSYSKNFRCLVKTWNFFDRAEKKVRKLNFNGVISGLKKIKNGIALLDCKNSLKFYVDFNKSFIKVKKSMEHDQKIKEKLNKVKSASLKLERINKRRIFNLLKNVEKHYKFEFSESKVLHSIANLVCNSSIGHSNINSPASKSKSPAFHTFFQLYSVIRTSFTQQKSQFSEIDKKCEQLEFHLSATDEAISETSKNLQNINSKIAQIRENKQLFMQSQNILKDLQSELTKLEQARYDLVQKTLEADSLENKLDNEVSEALKNYGKVELDCKETEHEIRRIEQEYSLLQVKKNNYVGSPERYNRLGASMNSPVSRNSYRSPVRSPRKYTNSSLNYNAGSPFRSPDRSRRDESFLSLRGSYN